MTDAFTEELFCAALSPASTTGSQRSTGHILEKQPRWFFHGHQHRNIETVIGNTKVIGTYGHRVIDI